MAKIANVALTNTFNTWRTNSNISFDRLSQFAINNSSLYANTITANVAFTSTGLATLSGRATVGTNLTVSGNTTLGAAGKTITSTGAAAHTGTKTISTNLTVSGNTTLGAAGKTITTTGLIGHTGRATISTNLTVSGNTTLGAAGKTITSTGVLAHTGNITVSGNTSLAAVTGTTVVASTVLQMPDGTVSVPGLRVGTSSITGLFSSGDNTLRVTSSGTQIASFTSTALKIGTTGTNGVLDLARTSDGATISTFKSDGTSGIINSATSTAFQINTTEAMSIDSSRNILINGSGANGVYSNTASIGIFSNNVNFSSKKIRNFTEDAMSYRASSTAITLSAVRNVQRVSLTGNATVTLPTGMPGKAEAIKTIVVIFKQDATGSRTMAFAAPTGETLLYNNSATLPAVSSAANKVTIYVCTKFDGDTRWYISQSFIEA